MAALLTPPASSLSKLMAQGRESAAALEALLRGASPQEHGEVQELAAEILRCCDRALAALHGDDGATGGRKRRSGAAAQTRPSKRTRASGGGETAAAKRVEKKWTAEDGFIWRKYGQKEILHSKHPRLYFRCTYKDDSGCRATRQVQLSEDDPSLYVITYFGDHTCSHGDAVLDREDVKMQPFVINFGSAAAAAATSGGGSPPWLSSSSDDGGDGQSETSRSSQAAGSPEEEFGEELRARETRIEPASSDHPAAELSSSPDASCCSPPWYPLAACSDNWDIFNEASFDYVLSDFFSFDDGIASYHH